jgi:hypothetical protein
MALVRCGSPQVKRFLFCCGPLIHQNVERNDLEPCPKCGQERQLPCRYPPAPLRFSFTRDAPALVAVKRLNTKRSTLLGRGKEISRLANLADFSMGCRVGRALANPNNI